VWVRGKAQGGRGDRGGEHSVGEMRKLDGCVES